MKPLRALHAVAAFALLTAAACTDKSSPLGPDGDPKPPPDGTGAPPTTLAALDCVGHKESLVVSCKPSASQAGTAAGDLIVGNQNVYVRLVSSNINYNSGTGQFTFDATLENLIEQPLGTVDGTTLDPAGIRIFFYTGPATSDPGTVAVIPDGFAFFTSAAQPYYTYPYVLDQNEVSPAETWTFIVPPTVSTFQFQVFVSAPVEYPTGYVTLDGELPQYDYGNLHPTTPHALTAVVKNPLGEVVPGTVTFATTNPNCATVSAGGVVTGVQAGTCSITATAGGRPGEMVFDVTGMTRTWNGSVGSDWSNGANWNLGRTPVAADSAVIPAAMPNNPALTAASAISGITVADAATLNLGAFNLTVGANLVTGSTGGITASGAGVLDLNGTGTARGRVPSLWVTGDYVLNGDLLVVAPQSIRAGRLRNPSYQLRIVSQ
ncbi:Ig-like domain-containing protein [Longimicrobium sp.]|uniref:Ig-like domain-containing protein n=1 Tax=Longimicrobium sp. TaxID=2029185 RepID=UPI003B3B33CB